MGESCLRLREALSDLATIRLRALLKVQNSLKTLSLGIKKKKNQVCMKNKINPSKSKEHAAYLTKFAEFG